MSQNLTGPRVDCRILRHDFANDIGSLKMNVEALKYMREDPAEFEELAQLMQETLATLESRVTRVLDTLATANESF